MHQELHTQHFDPPAWDRRRPTSIYLGFNHMFRGVLEKPALMDAYTNTINYLAFVDFLMQRGTQSDYIKAHIQTARRVVDFLLSSCPGSSQHASNLKAMASWLKTLHKAKLGQSQTQAQKNVQASSKLLSEGAMLGVVDKHMQIAKNIIDMHPHIYGQNVHFGNMATHKECAQVQVACLLGMSFGYLPSPRPGMLRHLIHPSSHPTKVCGCGEEDCLEGNRIWLSYEGGIERVNLIWGHHKNSARTSKPIPHIMLPLDDPLTRVLLWWIKVGFHKLRSGTMVSDDEGARPKPKAFTLFFDPTTSCAFTSKQWRLKFGDLCEEACGKRMAPNLTRHITIGAIHGAASPIVGAPTQEQLATAMGHSATTARMHYDRCKPQRDAQRAVDGMHAMRSNILALHGGEVARVVQGVAVTGPGPAEVVVPGAGHAEVVVPGPGHAQMVVKEETEVEGVVGMVESEYESDIEIDLDD